MNQIERLVPKGLPEAFSMMESKKGQKLVILAGGTDIVPPLREHHIQVDCFLDIALLGLDGIREQGDGVVLGACATMKQIATSPTMKKHFPALAKAAGNVGAVQTRGLATVGGNLCSGVPSMDSMPSLLVYDAVFTIESAAGTRKVAAAEFITGPRRTVMQYGDILTEIFLPFPQADFKSDFIKFGRRRALSLSIVNVAFGADTAGKKLTNARVAIGASAPTPVRALEAEKYLEGKTLANIDFDELARLVKASIKPISDIRASAEYRSDLAAALIAKLVKAAV